MNCVCVWAPPQFPATPSWVATQVLRHRASEVHWNCWRTRSSPSVPWTSCVLARYVMIPLDQMLMGRSSRKNYGITWGYVGIMGNNHWDIHTYTYIYIYIHIYTYIYTYTYIIYTHMGILSIWRYNGGYHQELEYLTQCFTDI